MKQQFLAILLLMAVAFGANAQAFERGGRYHSLGLGASSFFHAGYDYYEYDYWGVTTVSRAYRPITGQLNYQLEFGVHDYVGVGLTTGLGGRSSRGFYYSELNVPIGVVGNFHFYQLIDDKVSKDIHGDKLDIYVGLSAGSGVAFLFSEFDNDVAPIWFLGPHTGVRYYFSDRIAVNVETGFGKSFINAGITIRSAK